MAARDPLAHQPLRPAGEVPFGVIGDSEGDDLEAFFTRTFARVADGIDDLRRRFKRLF